MKLNVKIGDKGKVMVGKSRGLQGAVVFIDKKSKRVRLAGVKVFKSKGKKGPQDLHGTFHLSSLKIESTPEAPAPEASAPAQVTSEASAAPTPGAS